MTRMVADAGFVDQLHQTNYQFSRCTIGPITDFLFVYGQTKSDLRFARLVEQLVRWTARGKSLGCINPSWNLV